MSLHPRETLADIFAEAKTAEITATITRQDGTTPLLLSEIDTLELTLFVEDGGAIINSRDGNDILNTNGGTVHATSGLLTLLLDPLDMAVLGSARFETHIALIEWTYDVGAQSGGQEIAFTLQNFAKVTSV